MSLYDDYCELGKNSMRISKKDYVKTISEDGIKDLIRLILEGGNVRDATEFITQRRLLNSYISLIDLFMEKSNLTYEDFVNKAESEYPNVIKKYSLLYLWLLGLTGKGKDNITRDDLSSYIKKYKATLNDATEDFEKTRKDFKCTITYNENTLDLNLEKFLYILQVAGSQTLTTRGSMKSMSGKLFEKLVLGAALSCLGFTYCSSAPQKIEPNSKLFWLSHMDEHEREIDATVTNGQKAINIDIGFIGKGNPEITLDKVTRFGSYKNIGGVNMDMETFIIVDTVGVNSDLFNKAAKVKGYIFQMNNINWFINFSKKLYERLEIDSEEIANIENLDEFLEDKLKNMQISDFINEELLDEVK